MDSHSAFCLFVFELIFGIMPSLFGCCLLIQHSTRCTAFHSSRGHKGKRVQNLPRQPDRKRGKKRVTIILVGRRITFSAWMKLRFFLSFLCVCVELTGTTTRFICSLPVHKCPWHVVKYHRNNSSAVDSPVFFFLRESEVVSHFQIPFPAHLYLLHFHLFFLHYYYHCYYLVYINATHIVASLHSFFLFTSLPVSLFSLLPNQS